MVDNAWGVQGLKFRLCFASCLFWIAAASTATRKWRNKKVNHTVHSHDASGSVQPPDACEEGDHKEGDGHAIKVQAQLQGRHGFSSFGTFSLLLLLWGSTGGFGAALSLLGGSVICGWTGVLGGCLWWGGVGGRLSITLKVENIHVSKYEGRERLVQPRRNKIRLVL